MKIAIHVFDWKSVNFLAASPLTHTHGTLDDTSETNEPAQKSCEGALPCYVISFVNFVSNPFSDWLSHPLLLPTSAGNFLNSGIT